MIQKLFLIALAYCCLPLASAHADSVLTVYTSRKENLIKPQFDAFTKETGIKIQAIHDKAKALMVRLESEGEATQADVFLPTDAVNLDLAAQKGLLQPIESKALRDAIPKEFIDPYGRWYGLSHRVRAIIYNKDTVSLAELSSYEDLADPKWKDAVVIRSSSHAYNQSLTAALIATHGEAYTEAWAKGLVANMARSPQGGDRDQIRAVASGEAKLAVANSYYYARFLNSNLPEEKNIADKTGIFYPNQNASEGQLTGAHINISGAGVVTHSDDIKLATTFLEFMARADTQAAYTNANLEYPVNTNVEWPLLLQGFGSFKSDDTALTDLSKHAQEAIRISDRAGWK